MPRPTLVDARSTLVNLRTRAEAVARRIPRWVTYPVLLLLFAAAGWVAAAQLDVGLADLQVQWLAAAVLFGVPATVLANALEYRQSARAVGSDVTLTSAGRVAVVATAANLLPLPGGALVRIQALTQQGVRYRYAGASTVIVGLAWLGVAFIVAGIPLLAIRPVLGAFAALAGTALCTLSYLGVRRLRSAERPARWFVGLLVIELGSVLASAARLTFGMAALGVGLRPADGAVLAVSGVISNSVGLIPAGLGLKEAITAGLAAVVALPASLGFVVSVLDRVIGIVGHAALALPLLLRRPR